VRIRTAVAVVMTLAIVVTVGVVLVVNRLGKNLALRLPQHACVVDTGSGLEVPLDADQMANAATVSAVGISAQMPERAVVVALATAFQESKLRNLTAGDRDSVGLFQQRPSQGWGTPAEIADPRYAARRFYQALRKIQGWQNMRVTDAAQAVQRSAHPEAYEKWVDEAEPLAVALSGTATGAVACTLDEESATRGPAAAEALATSLRADWGARTEPVADGDLPGLAVPVTDSRAGWQYAHWLVAHAKHSGIKRVRYTDREWTAKGGSWTKVAPGAAGANRVVAEVYGDS
jgi:hypothetical protein